jgi:hypothetical protein
MNVLLHACCAPCSVQCVAALREEGIEPGLFWYNPNIHPYTEYQARRDTLAAFARDQDLTLLTEDDYGLRGFIAGAAALGALESQAGGPRRRRALRLLLPPAPGKDRPDRRRTRPRRLFHHPPHQPLPKPRTPAPNRRRPGRPLRRPVRLPRLSPPLPPGPGGGPRPGLLYAEVLRLYL